MVVAFKEADARWCLRRWTKSCEMWHSSDCKQVMSNVCLQVLDDQTFAALQSVMLMNNVEILYKLQQDPVFFPELFRKLKTTPPKVGGRG